MNFFHQVSETRSILESLRTLLRLVRLDLKHLFQRITNPILIVALILVLVIFALTLGSFHYFASIYAPLHGVSNPKFGLGGYEPLLFYLCILVALAFVLRLPNYREESIKNVVITYRAPSNYLLGLSRVLTPTLLVFGSVVVTALVYQFIASIDVAIRPGFVESFESHSLVFVLVELFVVMLFWTSLAVLISQVFKSAVKALFGTLLLLVLQVWISPLLPGELGSFTFGYGAASLYVSDLAPNYWEIKNLTYFLSVIVLAFAFIFANAWYHDRLDSHKRTRYMPMIIVLTSLGIVCQTVVQSTSLLEYHQHQSWIQAYDDARNSTRQQVTIEQIQGEVTIKPGSNLKLNLNYKVVLKEPENIDESPSESSALRLVLNPGMKVKSVQCSDNELSYSHQKGILKVDLDLCIPNSDHAYSIEFVVSGKPNPHYLVKHIPHSGRSSVSSQLVRLMGQRSSIFTADYVALTPSSHWYPQLSFPSSNLNGQPENDLVDFLLSVDLKPNSWTLLASGGKLYDAQDSQDSYAHVSGKFQSLGLMAADFRVTKRAVDSTDINVLVHAKHAKRLEQNKLITNGLFANVIKAMSDLNSYGIDYPFDQFTIVEVPSTLSLLNYDYNTYLGMDSIAMFRESGIPFARLHSLLDLQEQLVQAEADESLLVDLYKDQIDYMKSDYWTNPIFNHTYEDAIVESLVAGRINRADEHSLLTELVLETLIYNLLDSSNYRFDFELANLLASESSVNLRYIWAHRHRSLRLDLRDFQHTFMHSNAFWESIEQVFLTTRKEESQANFREPHHDLRIQRFRVLKFSELLADSFDERAIATMLTDILNSERSEPIDLNQISNVARLANIEIDPLIRNVLLSTKLPGINISVARQLQLEEPNEHGHSFNTVVYFRNSEDSVGYVTFHAVEMRETVTENQTLRSVANSSNVGPFALQEKSSYRLVMNTENVIGNLHANTYLSRNRGRVQVAVSSASLAEEQIVIDDDSNIWYSFVPSTWSSQNNENEIVVDDLDVGFEIPSTNYQEKSIRWTVGNELFRHYFPREEGMDNGLPIGQNRTGPWMRSGGLAESWGRYRHTFALADTSKKGIHKVSFNAELPKEGRWMLSYHLPDVRFFLEFQQAKLGNFDMDVSVGTQNWNLNVNVDNWVVGWNLVSNFDVESKGHARVAVSNKSDEPYVFADAIKWTYLD